jgi:hypothetical protein
MVKGLGALEFWRATDKINFFLTKIGKQQKNKIKGRRYCLREKNGKIIQSYTLSPIKGGTRYRKRTKRGRNESESGL